MQGFRVTDRDLEMVRWIGRHRFVEARQVAARFAMNTTNAYRRLGGLVALGLLAHRRILHGRPGAYWTTRTGLRTVGLRLPAAGVDIRTYDHDLLAASLSIKLEEEFGASAILAERELRSRDTASDQPRYAVALGGKSARSLHFPDLAANPEDRGVLAVEVELTPKGSTRLDTIVAGYVRARHIGSVRYYLAPAARRGVERAVERARATPLFDLRPLEEAQR